jgi:hypothetical protein
MLDGSEVDRVFDSVDVFVLLDDFESVARELFHELAVVIVFWDVLEQFQSNDIEFLKLTSWPGLGLEWLVHPRLDGLTVEVGVIEWVQFNASLPFTRDLSAH